MVSSATRARQTWSLMEEAMSEDDRKGMKVEYRDELFNAANGVDLAKVVARAINEWVSHSGVLLVIGHHPSLERLVRTMTGHSVALSSGSCAFLEVLDRDDSQAGERWTHDRTFRLMADHARYSSDANEATEMNS